MLKIGKLHKEEADGFIRLCSEISIGEKRQTLWFGVPSWQADALSFNRADPFLVAMLPTAMRLGAEVMSEDPVSERLHFQLRNDLIPTLAQGGELYHEIDLCTPVTSRLLTSGGAVAGAFSGGVDSMYTLYRHGPDSEYPLTHLAVFNSGVYEGSGYRKGFQEACNRCTAFAYEQGLATVFVDSNVYEVLGAERYLDIVTFRLAACALAVQGLVSVYLLSSGYAFEQFEIDVHHAVCFDPLSVPSMCTESLQFYLSGAETDRLSKLEAISAWDPSYSWLSPCIFGKPGKQNCGHCKKCMRDLATLYAFGKLECYNRVFDVDDYKRHLPERLGFVLANQSDPVCRNIVILLKERGAYIPPMAYRCADMFQRAIEKQKAEGQA